MLSQGRGTSAGAGRGAAFATIALVFAASRAAAYAAGVRFDVSPLTWYWQYIDPPLLQARLLESVFYSHAQPPLFNILLGVTLKLPAGAFSTLMHAQFLAMGLIAAFGLFLLLTSLRIPARASVVLTCLFTVLPATILYENWLFYEYLTMTLLVWMAVALHRFVARASTAAGVAFFALAAAAIFARSIFQIVWLVPIVAGLVAVVSPRLVRRCAAVPLLLVALLYAKNGLLFGAPVTSSWLGMNLARGTVVHLDEPARQALVASGALHPVAALPPFSPLDAYAAVMPLPAASGIAVLDRAVKSGGSPNYHAKGYLPVSRHYLDGALWTIRHEPGPYLRVVRGAVWLFFNPSTDHAPVERNRQQMRAYDELVTRAVYLRTPYLLRLGVGILAAYIFAGAYALVVMWQLVVARRPATPEASTVLFMAFTCLYVFLVSTLFEAGENQRMRFVLDPLTLALVAAGATHLRRRVWAPEPRT